jgi:hypothetical protein
MKGFVLSKRALMLTAATAALLAGPVLGDDFTDIKTKVTQAVKTSTADNGSPGDIHIESAGSVVITAAGHRQCCRRTARCNCRGERTGFRCRRAG